MATSAQVDLPYRPRSSWNAPPASEALDYQELSTGQFRILSVDGLNDSGILECSLQLASLDGPGAYTGVSYTWSQTDRIWYGRYDASPKPILIDGKLMQVSDKIANILCLALHHERRRLWIDAICINQSDTTEKGHQVAQMGRIFSGATDVLCFLNNPSRRTDTILEKIRLCPGTLSSKYSREDQREFHHLLEDDYWNRAWTLQEMVLAEKAFVCCGYAIVPLTNFTQFSTICKSLWIEGLSLLDSNRLRRGHAPEWSLEGRLRKPYINFMEVLRWTRGSYACQDPRDMLYSRLALAPDAFNLIPHADYTMSVEEVYKDFAANCITHYKSLEILTFATNTCMSLPSWVPDWTSNNRNWKCDNPYALSTASAIIRVSWKRTGLPKISHCRAELTVRGKILKRLSKGSGWTTALGVMAQTTAFRNGYADSELPTTGDVLCVLKSCPWVVFLRPVDDHYVVVGRNARSHDSPAMWKEVGTALLNADSIPEEAFIIR